MSTKPFVPQDRDTQHRRTSLPPARPWTSIRPGEVHIDPNARHFGAIGPDQGYVGRLLPLFGDEIDAGAADRQDVVSAGVAIAMRRAARFTRAPIPEDLEVAFLLLGVLRGTPGDWTRAGPTVAGHVEGLRYSAAGQAHVAHLVSDDWIPLRPDEVRERLESSDPESIWRE